MSKGDIPVHYSLPVCTYVHLEGIKALKELIFNRYTLIYIHITCDNLPNHDLQSCLSIIFQNH